MRKIVAIVLDGVGDLSCEKLGLCTPLEASRKHFLDALAECGTCGAMDSLEPGFPCGSDTAHMLIFGYEPRGIYRGRGAFEALGGGLDMKPGDIAFKSNYGTYDPATNLVITRRADRAMEKIGPILASSINGLKLPHFPEAQITCKYLTEHRCAVRIRASGMSGEVTGTDPLVDYKQLLQSQPLDKSAEALKTSQIINELQKGIIDALSDHPVNIERKKQNKNLANILLLRGPGIQIDIPPFSSLHPHIRPFVFAPTAIVAGVGMTAQMDTFIHPDATGDYFTNFEKKADFFTKMIEITEYNYCFMHVKATDDTGHDGRPVLRRDIIERIDRMMGLILSRLVDSKHELIIQICADHSTPICVKDHSCEPVPFMFCHLDNFKTRYRVILNEKANEYVNCYGQGNEGWKIPFDVNQFRLKTVDQWHNDDQIEKGGESNKLGDQITQKEKEPEQEPDFRITGGCTRFEGVVQLQKISEDGGKLKEQMQRIANLALTSLRPDESQGYAEVECAKGRLGRFGARELIKFAEKILD
ncbi:MAG: putative 2,3-bisphosphoglycerate-independent phosphoglycerate mutase [Streblomastix strix]|uniref:Putative 2,3-bisphosphoglycerate-independent phosphoglycerate mutase n=1 Tax=Streblomastix strix TaxID=222440 RepID=A0A5J4WWP3_9EUKA|nr:MAG: putative 2,3-bisphosphoglycerate-independent phosphoglycerate mutase [Streblomastix strix]